MKKVIVTPAGRKRYLEVLANNLNKYKDEFDEWIIWINTPIQEDIDYIYELQKKFKFIKTQSLSVEFNGVFSIFSFYKQTIDKDSVYVRLDDDIVYIHPKSLERMFEFRLSNPDPFLIYGNTLNNAICTHIHQRNGLLPKKILANYNLIDETGWRHPQFAEMIHRYFFEYHKNKAIENLYIRNWDLMYYERCSINAISWTGEEFSKFNGKVEEDEEDWLSSTKPKEIQRSNLILGNVLFVHYAFKPQRQYLDQTNVLEIYKKISEE